MHELSLSSTSAALDLWVLTCQFNSYVFHNIIILKEEELEQIF
jgi:hypothetical protein